MCIPCKTKPGNAMDCKSCNTKGCKGCSADFFYAFRPNKNAAMYNDPFMCSMGGISCIESSFFPIRTDTQIVVEPTPIAQMGTLEAVPSVEILPAKLKNYCDEYIAALSHLFPQDESSNWKHKSQHQEEQLRSATPIEASFLKMSPACYSAPDETLPAAVASANVASEHWDQSSTAADLSKHVHPYQQERWVERYNELIEFLHKHAHANVPYVYNENPGLGQWVKRQRHQYKLLTQGLHSNLDEPRIQALNMLGFIWDSHGAAWEEKFQEMYLFFQLYGHSNVPCIYQGGSQLSTWTKRQRRQYRLFLAGKKSTMDRVRISRLEAIGFVWDYYGNNKHDVREAPHDPS